MPLFEPIVPRRYVVPVLKALDSAPAPLRLACLTAAGLDDAQAVMPGAVLTVAQFEAMLTTVTAHPDHAAFAFEVGQQISLRDHGPLAPAIRNCRTLDERFHLQAKYFRLMSPILAIRYVRLADRGELQARPAASFTPAGLHMLFEMYAMASYSNAPKELLDPLAPMHIHMPMDPPRHLARYQALTAVRFHFVRSGLPELRVVFPDTMLTAPLTDHPRPGEPDGAAQLDKLQRQIGRSTRISEWTRLMLWEAEACQPTADALAELLSVGRRSFERALAAESVTYRELAKQVRFERACELLRNPHVPVSQIAYRLGYSDMAGFSHAFNAMAGCSPSAFRKNA